MSLSSEAVQGESDLFQFSGLDRKLTSYETISTYLILENSSSISGIIGDNMDLAEKTKYQRPQNKIRRGSFICSKFHDHTVKLILKSFATMVYQKCSNLVC